MGLKYSEDILIKCGVIFSLVGIAIMVCLITVLLVFPVLELCEDNTKDCEFASQAPEPIKGIVQPITLVISLGGIAAGIFLLRLGMWTRSRKTA
jgi:hypothetical protein